MYPFRELTNSKMNRLDEGNLASHMAKGGIPTMELLSEKKPSQLGHFKKNFDKSSHKMDFIASIQEKETAGNPYNPQRIEVGNSELTA